MKWFLILSLVTATLNAQCTSEREFTCSRLVYVKLGPSAISIGDHTGVGVAVFSGYRIVTDQGAADISIGYLGGVNSHDQRAHAYVLPSIRYLHYIDPCARRGLYLGGGLAYGGITSKPSEFRGMMGHLSLGYDMLRMPKLRQFVEIDLLQPMVRTCKSSPHLSYVPALTLTFGIGF